jgi:hypothetical protein
MTSLVAFDKNSYGELCQAIDTKYRVSRPTQASNPKCEEDVSAYGNKVKSQSKESSKIGWLLSTRIFKIDRILGTVVLQLEEQQQQKTRNLVEPADRNFFTE